MANKSKYIIEKIKSVIIVVLFLTTILLLYFYWGDISFKNIVKSAETAEASLKAEDVLLPSRISVCSGNDSYELVEGGFAELCEAFRKLSQTERIMAEEITEAQYREVMAYQSIDASFDYYVPFGEFCEAFDIKKPTGSDGIEAITEMGYSLGSAENIFIKDSAGGRYYRIVGTPDEDCFAAVKSLIETANIEGGSEYYTLGMYLGEGTENDVLVPLSLATGLADFACTAEFTPEDSEIKGQMAKLFFGDNFDFVRKIEEKSGTVVYMYGYGQRTLIADSTGTFEYKQEEEQDGSADGYFEALDKALQFAAEHGGFRLPDGSEISPYIQSVTQNPDGKTGYRFCFGMQAGSGRLYYQSGYPFIIEVIGGKVTYFKRDMISFDAEAVSAQEKSYNEAFSAVNMLAQNAQYIMSVVNGADSVGMDSAGSSYGSGASGAEFDDMIDSITGLTYGYVRLSYAQESAGGVDGEDYSDAEDAADSAETSEIRACWIVSAGTTDIYFGLYSAQPLGYSIRE